MICFDGFDNLIQSMRLSVRQLECLVAVADALQTGELCACSREPGGPTL